MSKATELRFYLHYPTLLKILVRFLSLFRLICVAMLAQREKGPQVPEGVKSVLRRTQPLMSGVVARSNQTAVWHPHVSSKARLCLVPGSYPSEFAHRISNGGPLRVGGGSTIERVRRTGWRPDLHRVQQAAT